MRRSIATGIGAAIVLALATVAQAQVVNPNKVAWDAPDHAITLRYELGYFLSGAAAPVQTVSVPVASVTPVASSFEAALPRPVLGAFVARMKACGAAAGGGEVCSEWSEASPGFLVSPRAIVDLRLVP
jgi:hypothetical protein